MKDLHNCALVHTVIQEPPSGSVSFKNSQLGSTPVFGEAYVAVFNFIVVVVFTYEKKKKSLSKHSKWKHWDFTV